MAPDITRHVEPEFLRTLLTAIRTRNVVEVEYQSLTNSRRRLIAPHALAFDGFRWHARAWSCDKRDFRDFVLSRIAVLGPMSPAEYDEADDLEWHGRTTLRLIPHPGLPPERRAAVELDYSMRDGVREVEVRLSMAFYFIMRMNLDLAELAPERAQIRLENLEAVRAAVDAARIASRQRSSRVAG